jgi:hypothetical protein
LSLFLQFTPSQQNTSLQQLQTTLLIANTQGRHIMDIFNAFLLFNLGATVLVLIGFASMRDTVSEGFGAVKSKLEGLNFAGTAGAATSVVVLASVANLFQ